jgi:serine/threonine protein kinase
MAEERYQKLSELGRGTYGVVYKMRDSETQELVAVKKIKVMQQGEGIHFTAIRELMLLQELDHSNIIKVRQTQLKDVFYKQGSVNLVLELAEHEVINLVRHPALDEASIKGLMLQLLQGIHHLHSNWVMHRDLKPGNLLLNSKGELKVTDFGLAKIYGTPKPYTLGIATMWYRAPEILFGTKHYGTAIDIWAVGCILGEFMQKHPMFEGRSDLDQLAVIFNTLGTPDSEEWQGMEFLPSYMGLTPSPKMSFRRVTCS